MLLKIQNVHEALYQIYEINCPWDRGSGPGLGPIWVYCENVLNLRKSFSQIPHQGEIN